jgi:VanZ family protein
MRAAGVPRAREARDVTAPDARRATPPLCGRRFWQHTREMPSFSPHAAAVLLAASVVAILYGCLYPFDIDVSAAALPGWEPTSRGDLVANVLLYLPFGFLFAWVAAGRRTAVVVLLTAVALGLMLSLGAEILQSGSATRTASTADILINAAGTAFGVVAYFVFRRISGAHTAHAWFARHLREPSMDPIVLLLGALWVALHTAPFVPQLDLHAMWAATRPLRELDASIAGVARHFSAWLILAACLRALLVRRSFWVAFALAALLSMLVRVFFVRQALSLNEPLGLACALPVIAVLRALPNTRAARPALVLVVAAWVVQSLAPFAFSASPSSFEWLPFIGFLGGGLENGYLSLLDKTFLYVGMLWLSRQAGRSVRPWAVALAALALALEVAQLFLPGRVADITDPLLVLLSAYVVSLSRRGLREAPAAV